VIDFVIDLGQHPFEEEVMELLLVSNVAVERPGNDAKTVGQGSHDDALAGQPAVTFSLGAPAGLL
jgi:hypothetical protein